MDSHQTFTEGEIKATSAAAISAAAQQSATEIAPAVGSRRASDSASSAATQAAELKTSSNKQVQNASPMKRQQEGQIYQTTSFKPPKPNSPAYQRSLQFDSPPVSSDTSGVYDSPTAPLTTSIHALEIGLPKKNNVAEQTSPVVNISERKTQAATENTTNKAKKKLIKAADKTAPKGTEQKILPKSPKPSLMDGWSAWASAIKGYGDLPAQQYNSLQFPSSNDIMANPYMYQQHVNLHGSLGTNPFNQPAYPYISPHQRLEYNIPQNQVQNQLLISNKLNTDMNNQPPIGTPAVRNQEHSISRQDPVIMAKLPNPIQHEPLDLCIARKQEATAYHEPIEKTIKGTKRKMNISLKDQHSPVNEYPSLEKPTEKKLNRIEVDDSTVYIANSNAVASAMKPALKPVKRTDDVKDKRPPISYTALIVEAISISPGGQITLDNIYNYLKLNYPFYRNKNPKSWQNSIRHNLSHNKCFINQKVPGSCGLWSLHPNAGDMFKDRNLRSKLSKWREIKEKQSGEEMEQTTASQNKPASVPPMPLDPFSFMQPPPLSQQQNPDFFPQQLYGDVRPQTQQTHPDKKQQLNFLPQLPGNMTPKLQQRQPDLKPKLPLEQQENFLGQQGKGQHQTAAKSHMQQLWLDESSLDSQQQLKDASSKENVESRPQQKQQQSSPELIMVIQPQTEPITQRQVKDISPNLQQATVDSNGGAPEVKQEIVQEPSISNQE